MLKYCDTLWANADQQNANNLLSNKCMQGGGDVIFCLSAYRGDLYPPLLPLPLLLRVNANTCVISPFELLVSAALPNLKWHEKLFKVFFFCLWQIVWFPPPPHTHTRACTRARTHTCELICRLQWNIMITRPIKSLIWGKCRYLLNPHYQFCWIWVLCLFLSPSIDVFSKVVINIPLRVPFFQLPLV